MDAGKWWNLVLWRVLGQRGSPANIIIPELCRYLINLYSVEPSLKNHKCIRCNSSIKPGVLKYSLDKHKIPLCLLCQPWFKEQSKTSTKHAILLYLALIKKKIPAELDKHDGFKRVDIVVIPAKLNIEVDGCQHNLDPDQAFTDLQRTYYSYTDGFSTLRIPNSLVKHKLQSTAKYIAAIVKDKK